MLASLVREMGTINSLEPSDCSCVCCVEEDKVRIFVRLPQFWILSASPSCSGDNSDGPGELEIEA